MKRFMDKNNFLDIAAFLFCLSLVWGGLMTIGIGLAKIPQHSPKESLQEFSEIKDSRQFKRVITPEQANTLIRANFALKVERRTHVIILDARDFTPHYFWSHIKTALHTPWRSFTKGRRSGELLEREALQTKVQTLGITKQTSVIIYGDWSQGWGEEARMLWLLEYLGHEQSYVVEGGWQALKALNIPKEWGSSPVVKSSSWQIQLQDSLRADTSKVQQLLKTKSFSIDARSQKEYEGATPYGSRYGGHFQKSIHLPWKSLLDQQNKLYSPQKLRQIFESFGLNPNEPIFTYCTGGIRSAFIYLALQEAGYKKAMNYDGSWWAWTKTYPPSSILAQ